LIAVKNRDLTEAPGKFQPICRKRLNLLQTSALEPGVTIIEQHPSKGCQ
jgi:hypothetical protein